MRYALTFSSRELADAAAAKLTDEGLTARVEHQVYVDASASSDEEVAEMRRRMELLAHEFGGDFLGSGTFTQTA
jgi:hypothetical protein